MGLTKKAWALQALAAGFFGAQAAELTILGQPLGGTLKVTGNCPNPGSPPRVACWVSKPYVSKDGARLGYVDLPAPDSRPDWAAYAMFKVWLSKSSQLERLQVETVGKDSADSITSSINSRFGLPTAITRLPEGIYAADWMQRDVVIKQLCSRTTGCKVEFITPESWAAQQAEVEARKAKRPVAP